MNREVEERVVEMQFDNKQFESSAKATIDTIENLNKTLESTNSTKAFSQLQNGINKVDLSGISEGVGSLVDKFSLVGMTGVKILDEISDKALEVGKTLWNSTIGQIQQGGKTRALNIANAQFKLKGLEVDWDTIKEDIDYAVDGTAYGLDQAANAAAQFSASGVSLGKDMKAALRGVSGIAAMTNSSYDEIARVFTAAAGKGRVQALEINRISLRGINVAAAMAKQWGITEADVREMAEKGQISFQMFADAMDNAFGEHAKKANETYVGSLSNVRAALSRIGEIFYTPIFDSQIKVNNQLRESINNIKKAMSDGDDTTEDFGSRFSKLAHLVSDVSTILIERLSPSIDAVKKKLEPVNKAMDKANVILSDLKDYLSGLPKVEEEAAEGAEKIAESVERITEADKKIALDIWKGSDYYGNGQERIDRLGDSYERVQKYIDAYIANGYDVAKTDEALGISAASAAGDVDSLAGALSKAKSSLKYSTFDNLAKVFNNISKAADNVKETLTGTAVALINAFKDVFSLGQTVNDLVDLSEVLLKVSEAIKPTEKGFENLKRTFRGVISAFDILWQLIRAVVKSVGTLLEPLIGTTSDLGGSLLETSGSLGDFLYNLDETIKKGDIFTKAFSKVVEAIKNIPNSIKNAVPALKTFVSNGLDKLTEMTGIDFKGIFSAIATSIKKVVNSLLGLGGVDLEGVTSGIKKWAKTLWEAIKNGDYENAIKIVWSGIKNVFIFIKDSLSNVINSVKNVILNSGLGGPAQKLFDILSSIKNKIVEIFNDIFNKSSNKKASNPKDTKIGSALEGESNALEIFKETLITLWDGIKTIFNGIIDFLTGSGGGRSLWDIIKSTVENIGEVLKAAGFDNVKDAIVMIALSRIINILKIFAHSSDVFRQLGAYIKAKKGQLKVGVFTALAKALAMIVGSIVALAITIRALPNETTEAFYYIEAIMISMIAIIGALQLVAKTGLKIAGVGTVLRNIGTALVLAVLSIVILAKALNKTDNPEGFILAILGVLAMLGVMVFVVKEMTGLSSATRGSAKAIRKVGSAMEAMAFALIIMSFAVKIIGELPTENAIQGGLWLIAMLGMMILIIMALEKLNQTAVGSHGSRVSKVMNSFALVMLSVAAATYIMAPAIVSIGSIPWKNALQGVLAIVAIIAAIMGALIGITKLGTIKPLSLTTAALAIAIVASSMLALILPITSLGNMNADAFAIGMLGLVGGLSAITLALIGISKSSLNPVSMIAAATAMTVMIIALQGLAPMIKNLGELNLKQMGKALLAVAGFFAVMILVTKFINPASILLLAGVFAVFGLGILFLANAFLAMVKAIVLAAAAFDLLDGTGKKIGNEIGDALGAIAWKILEHAGVISLAISTVLTAVLANLLYTLIAWIPAVAEAIVTFLVEVLKVVDNHIYEITYLVVDIGFKIGEALVTAIWQHLGGFFSWLYNKLPWKEDLESWGEAIYDMTHMSDPEYLDMMYDIGYTSDYVKNYAEKTDEAITDIDDAMEKTREATYKLNESVKQGDAAVEKAKQAKEKSDKILSEMDDELSKLGISSTYSVKRNGNELADSFMSGINRLPNEVNEAGVETGRNFVNGINAGISEAQSALKTSVNNIGSTIVNTINTKLRIKSPSKEGEETGTYYVEGIMGGMGNMSGELKTVSSDLGEDLTSSFTTSLDDTFSDFSISDTFNDAFGDEELTVVPVWDQSELTSGLDEIEGATSGIKIGGLSSNGFDLSSFINSDGNLSFDMANMDNLLSQLNLEEYFGGLTDSNATLAGAIDNLSGNIYDMNNKDSVINLDLSLDGYNIANATAPFQDSVQGDRQEMTDRGLAVSSFKNSFATGVNTFTTQRKVINSMKFNSYTR